MPEYILAIGLSGPGHYVHRRSDPDLPGQPRGHRPDGRGLRAGDPPAVPAGQAMTTTAPRDAPAEVGPGCTERMWTARLRHGFFDRAAARQAAPGRAAGLRLQLDLRVRRPDHRRAGRDHRVRVACWRSRDRSGTTAPAPATSSTACISGRSRLFFFTMVIHLWGKFWMAAWRGRRVATWVTGAIAFLASIGTAFTGYLVQTNFDSQWIAAEAKDGLNSVGIGAWFNVLNVGQALLHPRRPAAPRARPDRGVARAAGPPPRRRAADRAPGSAVRQGARCKAVEAQPWRGRRGATTSSRSSSSP